MPRSLVTGGAGFMGSHIARECVALGHDVTVVDDLSGGFTGNVPEGVTFVQGDVSNRQEVDGIFHQAGGFDYVYHLAAYAAEGLSHFIRNFNYRNNVIGSVNLINASVNFEVRCLVFTSSIAVYGAAQVPMTEEMTPQPEDPYGIAKYAVEMDLAAAKRMFGLDHVIFRPHNVYGEGQNTTDRYRNVIGIFMNQVMGEEPMTIFGDGKQTRAFTHIADVAPIIASSVDVPAARNETFNVGADKPYSVNQLSDVVATAFGVARDVAYLPAREEVVHAYSSHEKVQKVFGTRTSIDLEEGISRMVEWAKSRGAQPPSTFGDIEITKGLPPSWAAVVDGAD